MRVLFRFIYTFLIFLLFSFVFLLTGCSDKDESNLFTTLLRMIPSDTDLSMSFITIDDYGSFFEDNDLALAEFAEQSIDLPEFMKLVQEKELTPLVSLPTGVHVIGWGAYSSNSTIIDKYVGYNYGDVVTVIQAGHPPQEIVGAIGRFDPEATRNALSYQDEWPFWAVDAYTTEDYHGVTIHSWGDGYSIHLADTLVPPHIDELGRAKPLAVTDTYLMCTASLDSIKSMIDASQGKTESLADLPEYSEIVDTLFKLNVYSVVLGTETKVNGDPEFTGTYPGPRLKKFITFGASPGKDEKGLFTALVLYHEDPEDARANISLLEQRIAQTDSIMIDVPWTDIITGTDIEVDRNILIAKLYTDSPSLLTRTVYTQDTLILHE